MLRAQPKPPGSFCPKRITDPCRWCVTPRGECPQGCPCGSHPREKAALAELGVGRARGWRRTGGNPIPGPRRTPLPSSLQHDSQRRDEHNLCQGEGTCVWSYTQTLTHQPGRGDTELASSARACCLRGCALPRGHASPFSPAAGKSPSLRPRTRERQRSG